MDSAERSYNARVRAFDKFLDHRTAQPATSAQDQHGVLGLTHGGHGGSWGGCLLLLGLSGGEGRETKAQACEPQHYESAADQDSRVLGAKRRDDLREGQRSLGRHVVFLR